MELLNAPPPTHLSSHVLHNRLRTLAEYIRTNSARRIPIERSDSQGTAAELVSKRREKGLFIRDASSMGDRAIRIAVKDEATNQRMLHIIKSALDEVR
jgi:histidinol-phosphate/aromatic aminotransferase/cobyric acid decarboxylase-like protein